MRRRALWCVATIGLLVAPVSASASWLGVPAAVPPKLRPLVRAELRSGSSHRHSWESRVYLQPQHGYDLALAGRGNVVDLEVMRTRRSGKRGKGPRSRGRAITAYVTRGTVTSRRIEASFGDLGSVALRFRPARHARHRHAGHRCRKRHRSARQGVFVGHLRFTGEDRYVTVRAHRARGWIRRPSQVRCHHRRHRGPRIARRRAVARPAGGSPGPSYAALTAEWRHVVTSTGLLAIRVGTGTLAVALAEESLGRMAKVHFAVSITNSAALVHDDALTSAKVRPPAPFSGKGLYRAAPDGTHTWSGSLTVDFPGAPRVPLTGTQFETRLRAGL